MEPEKLEQRIVEILDNKKAKDIVTIDIRKLTVIADFFVICSGTSSTHIKSLADELEEKLGMDGIHYYNKEGYDSAKWILYDYGDVVVHIFHGEERNFYNIERLWSDGIFIYR